MTSRGGTRASGCVQWPVHLPAHPHRPGTWVFAMVPAQAADQAEQFTHCMGPAGTILLPAPVFMVEAESPPDVYQVEVAMPPIEIPDRLIGREVVYAYTEAAQQEIMARCDSGRPVLAAVCLGTTNRSWVQPNGEYWHCTSDLITPKGRTLLAALQDLYKTHPRLVTYLTT